MLISNILAYNLRLTAAVKSLTAAAYPTLLVSWLPVTYTAVGIGYMPF